MSIRTRLKRFGAAVGVVTALFGITLIVAPPNVRIIASLLYVLIFSTMVALLPFYLQPQRDVVNPYDINDTSALRHPKE